MSAATPIVLVLALSSAAPPNTGAASPAGFAIADMPDPHGGEWSAPPPPPRPLRMGTTLSAVPAAESPTRITTTRPFDPSTPPVMQHHQPNVGPQLSKRERTLVFAALGVEAVAFVPFGFMIHSTLRTVRARNEAAAFRGEHPLEPVPRALVRDFERHRAIALGCAAAAFVMNVAALAMLVVALRRHRRDSPTRTITQMSPPRVALGVGL